MAVPKRRHSRSRTRKRRSHDFLTAPSIATCPECGEPKLLHRLCGGCGKYKDMTVIRLEDDLG